MTKAEALKTVTLWLDRVPSGRVSIIKKRGGEYEVTTQEDLHTSEDARRVFGFCPATELLNGVGKI